METGISVFLDGQVHVFAPFFIPLPSSLREKYLIRYEVKGNVECE